MNAIEKHLIATMVTIERAVFSRRQNGEVMPGDENIGAARTVWVGALLAGGWTEDYLAQITTAAQLDGYDVAVALAESMAAGCA